MSVPESNVGLIISIAHSEAEKVLAKQTIPTFPAYFFEGRWLITYDWWSEYHQRTLDKEAQLENRIIALHQRIAVLERPWWRRWLSR